MKQFFLLLKKYTFVPVPKKLIAPNVQLPKSLRFLPILGLFYGGVLFFSVKALAFLPAPVAAILLVGINLLFGGIYLLKELMTVADGISGQVLYPPNMEASGIPDSIKKNDDFKNNERQNVGKAGLVWGIVWLIVLYCIYLSYFWWQLFPNIVFLLTPIISYWLITWTIYGFFAKAPAWLHNNYSKRDFLITSTLTLLFVFPFSSIILIIAIVIAFLGIHIFALYRQRSAGALVDSCYGASGAWGQVIFYLAWLTFAPIL